MNPPDVAARYFASVLAGDLDGLIALYAHDATFVLPNGREFSGVDAIREMHRGVFASGGPKPCPQTMIVGEHSIAVEIESRLPDGGVRRTANFYYLNGAGKIQKLSVYARSA